MNLLKLIFIFSLFNFSNGKNKCDKFEEENSGDDDMIMSDEMMMKIVWMKMN